MKNSPGEEHREIYRIFGRAAYPTPLAQITTVTARSSAELLPAVQRVKEQNSWVELVAIPESAIVQVVGSGAEK